jgi:hypothetical protein
MKIEINLELDDRLFGDIFFLQYVTERKTRSETIPGKTVEINGIIYSSQTNKRYFEKTRKVANYKKISFNQMIVDEKGQLTLEYEEYRGCGEYDNHWFDASIIHKNINETLFFTEEEASNKAIAFNYKQEFSEEKEKL